MFQTSLPLWPWTRPVTRTDVKVSISVMIACCSATASHCLKGCACKCGVWGKFNAKAFGIASWANDCQHVSALRFCLCPSTSTEDSEILLFTSLQNTFHTSSHIYPPLSLSIYIYTTGWKWLLCERTESKLQTDLDATVWQKRSLNLQDTFCTDSNYISYNSGYCHVKINC